MLSQQIFRAVSHPLKDSLTIEAVVQSSGNEGLFVLSHDPVTRHVYGYKTPARVDS